MSYRVSIRKQALKELAEIPKNESSKIVSAIDGLREEPRPSGCKKLKGEHEYFWRIRVGKIGHLKDVYE